MIFFFFFKDVVFQFVSFIGSKDLFGLAMSSFPLFLLSKPAASVSFIAHEVTVVSVAPSRLILGKTANKATSQTISLNFVTWDFSFQHWGHDSKLGLVFQLTSEALSLMSQHYCFTSAIFKDNVMRAACKDSGIQKKCYVKPVVRSSSPWLTSSCQGVFYHVCLW